jgi:hypothetical protein
MTNCWLDRSGKFRAVQLFRCLPLHLLLGGRQEPAEAGLLLSICSISPEDESLGDEVGRVRGGRHRYGMVLCGERVDAATALRIRLVEEVVPRAQGLARALQLAASAGPQGRPRGRCLRPVGRRQ